MLACRALQIFMLLSQCVSVNQLLLHICSYRNSIVGWFNSHCCYWKHLNMGSNPSRVDTLHRIRSLIHTCASECSYMFGLASLLLAQSHECAWDCLRCVHIQWNTHQPHVNWMSMILLTLHLNLWAKQNWTNYVTTQKSNVQKLYICPHSSLPLGCGLACSK